MEKVNSLPSREPVDLEPESIVALINNWDYNAREPIILQLIDLYDSSKFEDPYEWSVFWKDMNNISAIDIVAGENLPYVNGKLLPQSNLEQIMREYLSKQLQGRFGQVARLSQIQRSEGSGRVNAELIREFQNRN